MANAEVLFAPTTWRETETDIAPAWWEKTIAVAGLLILFETFRIMLLGGDGDRTGGTMKFQVISGGIYLAAIGAVLIRGIPPWIFRVLLRSWPLVVLQILPIISTLWSQSPGSTMRRAIALILCSGFALFLVIRFNPRQLFNLLAITFAVFVTVGVLSAGIPGIGITPNGQYSGAWRGLAGQKNVFARTLAIEVMLLPVAAVIGMVDWRRLIMIICPIGLALLVLAKSATSLVAAFGGVVVGLVIYIALGGRIAGWRLGLEIGLTFLVIAAVAGFLFITFGWTDLLTALGRDPTLTGRTKLWQWAMAINATNHREWLGSGYRAFWIDDNTKYFFEAFAWNAGPDGRSDTFAGPEHAHSGYIDVYLELGYVGVTALVATILSGFINLRRALASGNIQIGFIFAVILSFLLIYASTERSILQQSEDLWCLFATLYLFTVKETLLNKPATPQ